MRSLTAGLARQAMVAVTMGALLIAGLSASWGGRHAPAASASIDQPIPTRAIVIAEAPPSPAQAPLVKPAPAAKPTTSKSAPRHLAAAPFPRPRPADPAPQVVAAAYVGPAQQTDRPFDLKKQLFAPVGFVRDNVARLMSKL
jgi:translation initiation factor IF-2